MTADSPLRRVLLHSPGKHPELLRMAPHLDLSTLLASAFPPGNAAGALHEAEVPVHVIPQAGEPRWVIIGDSSRAAPVLSNWRPFKVSTRVRWAAVVTASSLGMLSRLPGVISTRRPIDLSYWRTSLPGFQDDWVPVLYVGNSSHTRKVTLFFVGRYEPRFKAAAKVPLQPLSAPAILNEAEILEQLAGSEFIPVSLFKDPRRGIAAQSWLRDARCRESLCPHIWNCWRASPFLMKRSRCLLCVSRSPMNSSNWTDPSIATSFLARWNSWIASIRCRRSSNIEISRPGI